MSAPTRQLVGFGLLAFSISWAIWAVCLVSGQDVTGSSITWLFAIGASGPTLAAVALWIGIRRRMPGITTSWRRAWLWAPLALLLGLAPAVLAALTQAPARLGERVVDNATAVVAASGGWMLFVITYLIAGPLAEEFGWRGFVQPRLRTRFGLIGTSLVLGTVWAAWHLPLYLLNGTGQNATGLFTVQALLFFVGCIPTSTIFLVLSERLGGGVTSAVLLHFALNVGLSVLPLDSALTSALYLGWTTVIAVILTLTVWRPGTRSRIPTPSVPDAADPATA